MVPMGARVGARRRDEYVTAATVCDCGRGFRVIAAVGCGCDHTALGCRRARRQGGEADGSIGTDSHRCQGLVMIDEIENLRMDLINVGIYDGSLRERRIADVAYERGFLTQETDDVIDIVEGVPGDRLLGNGVVETYCSSVQIIDDGLLVAGIDATNEFGRGIVEDEPSVVHRFNEVENSIIG